MLRKTLTRAGPTKVEKPLKRSKLHGLHIDHRAKMASYAGWHMPIQYEGMATEHLHTRSKCSLFDVSHMGQVRFVGPDREKFIEWVTVVDMNTVPLNRGRLTVLMNESAGVIDDLIVHRCPDYCKAVLNAARFPTDMAHFTEKISEFGGDVAIDIDGSRSLLALQGPSSAEVLKRFCDGVDKMPFLACETITINGVKVDISRSGYTGEDGYELSVKHADAEVIAKLLLNEPEVKEAGLGARNSLRVEAGLCLYGKELDEHISINEACLMWLCSKRRREEGGFVGYEALAKELADPLLKPMRRVGIVSNGLCPRDGAPVMVDGAKVGYVTSGCPSPSLKCNVAQAYVHYDHRKPGTKVELVAREGRPAVAGEIVKMPFLPNRRYVGDSK